jgi:acyl-CoA synthetase (AMP-forming)/AMP-acid ligase II
MLVPTMLKRILEVLAEDGQGIPSVRHLAYGGGRMPLPIIESALRTFGSEVAFVNAYGLTETSSTISILGPEDHRASFGAQDPVVARRLGSVGKAVPGVALEIRDPAGRPCGTEERGEVWVRGEQVSGEYAERADDGGGTWFNTHDVGWLDAEDYLFLEGRADDVIVRGGFKVAPETVVRALRAHPAVGDAAVAPIPDERLGQIPVAAVELRAGAEADGDSLREHCRTLLTPYEVPARIFVVDALPRGAALKVDRRQLLAMLDELGAMQKQPT